jgi:hypothetical protein
VIAGESVYFFLEKQQAIQEMAHYGLPLLMSFVGWVSVSVTQQSRPSMLGYAHANPTYIFIVPTQSM